VHGRREKIAGAVQIQKSVSKESRILSGLLHIAKNARRISRAKNLFAPDGESLRALCVARNSGARGLHTKLSGVTVIFFSL
jgi:hypothetical protein